MRKREVTGKLGNMRKAVEWTVYPYVAGADVTIQSEKRSARIFNLESGKAVLSNPGSGYTVMSHFRHGASIITVPAEMLTAIKAIIAGDNGTGEYVFSS